MREGPRDRDTPNALIILLSLYQPPSLGDNIVKAPRGILEGPKVNFALQHVMPVMSLLGHVWTAPWQELSDVLQHWSGAVTCPAC